MAPSFAPPGGAGGQLALPDMSGIPMEVEKIREGRSDPKVREAHRRQLRAAMVALDPEDLEPLRVALEAGRKVGLAKEDIKSAADLLKKLDKSELPLVFTDVLAEDMERLQAAKTREQAVAVLMRCFSLSLEQGFAAEVLTEFHYHNFVFCQQQRFGAEKTSTLLSLMKVVHSKAILEDKLDVQKARRFFEALLGRHSRQLPPYSVGTFSGAEVSAIRSFADRNFFRLYRLHCYLRDRREELSVRTVTEAAVPKAPEPTKLHASHELANPREVPELFYLFHDPEAEARAAAEAAAAAEAERKKAEDEAERKRKEALIDKNSPAYLMKAAISKAVDTGVEARLDGLKEQLDPEPPAEPE